MIETEGRMYQDLTKILVTREEIAAKVDELGKKITADYQGKAPVLICILKGGAVFFTDLARAIDLPLTMEFMAISSYGSATKTSGVVKIIKDLDQPLEGKDVLIVEDIIDSGNTLSYLMKIFRERRPKSLKICTLLDKPERREVKDVSVDYCAFRIPDEFVVGYGLDYDQKYRNLPYIGVVSFT